MSVFRNVFKQNIGGFAFFSSEVAAWRNFKIGDAVSITKKITKENLEKFIELSGDTNPIHMHDSPERAIVHGALLNGLVSGVIGTRLPGPGTLVISQNLNFPNKCYVDETVNVTVTMREIRKIIKVDFICEVADRKKVVLHGEAKLIKSK